MTIWKKAGKDRWEIGLADSGSLSGVNVFREDSRWAYEIYCVRDEDGGARKLASSGAFGYDTATEAKKAAWREFLRSVAKGETFDFLQYANPAAYGKKEWRELSSAMVTGYTHLLSTLYMVREDLRIARLASAPDSEFDNLVYEAAGELVPGENINAGDIIAEILGEASPYDKYAIDVKIVVR